MAKRKYKSTKDKKKEIEQLTEDRNKEVEKFFQSPDQLKDYFVFMSKFYNYSARNSILIQKQFMGAEAVGSFNFWKEKGYPVQKGEKGIKILVPYKYKTFDRVKPGGDGTIKTPLKYATKNEKDAIDKGKIPVKDNLAYTTGHVFDISQTNATAEALPEIFPNKWLDGSVENYSEMFESLRKIATDMDVSVLDTPTRELGAAKGAYIEYGIGDSVEKSIELNPRNSELNNVKTLIHELAHAKLHNSNTDHSKNLNHSEKEFQAELTAFTVCSHFNLDTSDTSLNYLHHYTKRHESINDKLTLIEEVKSTSYEFITHLEADLEKEKGLGSEEQKTTEKVNQELQETYGEIEVIVNGEVTKVEDLSSSEFESVFEDQHGRNVLSRSEFEGLDKASMIKSFNDLSDSWQGDRPIAKMIDPEISKPKAYIEWSESGLEQNLMDVEDLDRVLAAANLESLKETGYDKTRVHLILPDEGNGVTVQKVDRIDLGDGTYGNLHDHLKETQPRLSNYVPADTEHLGDIYSKSNVAQTLNHIYREDLHLNQLHNPDEHRLSVSHLNVKNAEDFAVNHDIFSGSELEDIQNKASEQFAEENEHINTKNQMVNLKGQYTKYQQLIKAENTGDLTEEKIINRMAAENQYTESKNKALQEGYVTNDTILKMEENVLDQVQEGKSHPTTQEKDHPFGQSGRKSNHKSTGLSM